jgi:hypothetical protein
VTPWPDITRGELIGLGWALLVADREHEVWERARYIPGFRWSAVGLLDPEVDRALTTDDPPFGVILYSEGGQTEGESRQDGLFFEEIQLPVVIRHGTYEEHRGAAPGLPHGRLACWAASRQGGCVGWLTARHVADHPAMASVGRVVDRAPECLDAALVEIGAGGGGSRRPLATPAPGGRVRMDLANPVSTTILDVATNLGVQQSSRFPLRFTTTAAGLPGDSGSLIRGDPCWEPLGLYLGSFAGAGTSLRSGVGLALSQLEYHMFLEVYE